ncbi:MAG TPA: FAD-dependent oxidoreductase [Gemmatimonadales bacterium]|nr:FAD-dependent oxidoreductase [Gemmatimonadales bacterium]
MSGARARGAEVVIVGAGVMGASVAWHLARCGVRDILLLDRAAGPGAGSTGRATGGFRVQFDTAANVALSVRSREKLLDFPAEVGGDPGYTPCGYLFVARREGDLSLLRQAQAVQHAAGAPWPREVGPAEVLELNPALVPDGILGGVFSPVDGFIRPMAIAGAYLEGAERMGARVEWGVEALGFAREGDRVVGVVTRAGPVPGGAVVNAAGPWAGRLAECAGLDLPVRPTRRQVAVTVPTDLLPEAMPMTAYVEDGFHTRVRDGRILWLWPHELGPEEADQPTWDERWVEKVMARARARLPAAARAPIDPGACHCGLYEMSPDRHAILGEMPGAPGLFLINGSSGHGVMHAPALGEGLAAMILGGAPPLDVTAFRPSRFAEGKLNAGTGLL